MVQLCQMTVLLPSSPTQEIMEPVSWLWSSPFYLPLNSTEMVCELINCILKYILRVFWDVNDDKTMKTCLSIINRTYPVCHRTAHCACTNFSSACAPPVPIQSDLSYFVLQSNVVVASFAHYMWINSPSIAEMKWPLKTVNQTQRKSGEAVQNVLIFEVQQTIQDTGTFGGVDNFISMWKMKCLFIVQMLLSC